MSPKKLKKLDDVEYTGPKKTFTQELSPSEIQALLEGYVETDYVSLKKGFHIRYFSTNKKTGEKEFKMGGTILKISSPDYIVLSNGSLNWSVQIDGTIFFQQMTMQEIKTELQVNFDADMHVKNNEILKLKLHIKAFKKEISEKKNEIEALQKTISERDDKIEALEKKIKRIRKKD